MLRVPIDEARSGMVLSAPVLHPRNPGTILLRSGVQLSPTAIKRLREINTRELWIECPTLEEVADFVSPNIERAKSAIACGVAAAFDDARSGTDVKLDFARYASAVSEMIERIGDEPKAGLFLRDLVDSGEPAVRHASTVCYLSLLMGLILDFYLVAERPKVPALAAKDVSNLGIAAMLHDIGMTRLEPEVLERWSKTRNDKDPEYRAHTQIGYELVRGWLEPSAASAVLHHHQRYDGTGFPTRREGDGTRRALEAKQIHVFPRIIACADLFDRLAHPAHAPGESEADHPSIPVVRALKLMQSGPYKGWIDPVVFSALLRVVPPFAPGSTVGLSTGERGIVVDWHADDPCRPTVALLPTDAKDVTKVDRADMPRFDLRGADGVSITRIDGEDVSADVFGPDHIRRYDLAVLGRESVVHNAA